MTPKFSISEKRGRDVTQRESDGPDWDAIVDRILGPRLVGEAPERRHSDAVALLEAATRAAGRCASAECKQVEDILALN